MRPLPTRVELTNNIDQETENSIYTEQPVGEVPETREDQNIEEENIVRDGQESERAVEVEPNQAELDEFEANNRSKDPVAGTDETVVTNVANRPLSYISSTKIHVLCAWTYAMARQTPMAIQLSDVPKSEGEQVHYISYC